MFKRILVCAFGIMLFCTIAEARQATFTSKDRGLADVVKRECKDRMWTSEVMKLTGIDSSDLNSLKVGDTVVVPDYCETLKPSKKISKATLRIFNQQKILSQAELANKNLIKTAEERDSWWGKAIELKDQNKEVTTERDAWQTKANEFEQQNKVLFAKQKGLNWSFWSFALGCMAGAILAYGAYWLQLHKLVQERLNDIARICELEEELRISNQRQDELRSKLAALTSQEVHKLSITFHGKVFEFPITSKPLVTCQLCGEKRIVADEHHIEGHMIKSHRLTKISPDKMREDWPQTD